ncbi:MAG TPA: PepSY domain-containing protein [Steroidobacteraceae bacterium]|nr:PepSY domain-containing protein [Steroidobacteraceae bacterium]
MRGLPGRQPQRVPASVRIALTGGGLSLMLALIVSFALLSHPAQGVVLPATSISTQTLAAGVPTAQVQDEQRNANGRSNVDRHQLSRAEAVALVQRRYRARVVRTQYQQDANGRAIYEFRLLSAGGKVWTVRIDAYSGAELP